MILCSPPLASSFFLSLLYFPVVFLILSFPKDDGSSCWFFLLGASTFLIGLYDYIILALCAESQHGRCAQHISHFSSLWSSLLKYSASRLITAYHLLLILLFHCLCFLYSSMSSSFIYLLFNSAFTCNLILLTHVDALRHAYTLSNPHAHTKQSVHVCVCVCACGSLQYFVSLV